MNDYDNYKKKIIDRVSSPVRVYNNYSSNHIKTHSIDNSLKTSEDYLSNIYLNKFDTISNKSENSYISNKNGSHKLNDIVNNSNRTTPFSNYQNIFDSRKTSSVINTSRGLEFSKSYGNISSNRTESDIIPLYASPILNTIHSGTTFDHTVPSSKLIDSPSHESFRLSIPHGYTYEELESSRSSQITLSSPRKNSVDNNDLTCSAYVSDSNTISFLPPHLLQMSELLNADLSSGRVVQKLIEASTNFINAERVNLYLLNDCRDRLILNSSNIPLKSSDLIHLPALLGLAGYCAKTGNSISIAGVSNIVKDWRYDNVADQRPFVNQLHSILCVALRSSNGTTIGILEALNSKTTQNKFNEQDEILLKSISIFASTILHRDDLEKDAFNRKRQAEALLQVAELTSSEIGSNKAMQRILRSVNMVLNCACESLHFYNIEENGDLVCLESVYNTIVPESSFKEIRIQNGLGFLGQAAILGRIVVVNDATNDWRIDGSISDSNSPETRWKNMLLAPLRDVNGKVTSVICAANKINKPSTLTSSLKLEESCIAQFTEDDKTLISSLVITAAGTLHQAKLYDEAIRRRKQTESLLHITELMSAELGTEKVVSRIIEAAYSLVSAERISLFFIEDAQRQAKKQNFPYKKDSEQLESHYLALSPQTVSSPTIHHLRSPSFGAVSPGPTLKVPSHNRSSSFSSPIINTHSPGRPQKELVCVISKDESFVNTRIPWGVGIVGHVALTGKSLNIPNAYSDERFDQSQDKRTGFITNSILTVPVFDTEGKCQAIIQAINRTGDSSTFLSEDCTILESLAVSAGIILRKSTLYRAAMQAERRSNALMQLVKIVSNKSATVIEIIRGIVNVVQSALTADRVTIFFVDASRKELFSIYSVTDEADSIKNDHSLPLGDSLSGWVAAMGKTINLINPHSDTRFSRNDTSLDLEDLYNVLCVPVFDKDGSVIAVIQATNKKTEKAYKNMSSSSGNICNVFSSIADISKAPVYNCTSNSPSPTFGYYSPRFDSLEQPNFSYDIFSNEDVSMIEAFATELSSTLHRCFTEAILEHYTHSSNSNKLDIEGISSLVDFYNRRPHRDHSLFHNASLTNANIKFKFSNYSDHIFEWPSSAPSVAIPELNTLDFDVWKYSADDLLSFVVQIFEDVGLCSEFQISQNTLQMFTLQVRNSYHSNPFHNWYHAFSVFHFSYMFLRLTKITVEMSNLDVLGLLVASLCHDLDHPGRTNSFEINTDSEKALLYNDHSVLENHHATSLFKILADNRFNIFENIPKSSYRMLRSSIIESILATDMAIHFERSKDLDLREPKKPFDFAKEKEKQKMLDMIVHSADLSGQVFKTEIAIKWEEKISAEFNDQALEEAQLGLPVAPFMQNLSDPQHRSKLQVNFIEFVLEPWWRSLIKLYPTLKPCYANLQINKAYFQKAVLNSDTPVNN